MANLTIAEGVVKEIPDLNPIDGHAVVIFEQMGEGHEFRQVIYPGGQFRKRWGKRYFAYKVNAAPSLKLEFSDRVLNRDQIHSFDLNITLYYAVSEPPKIVIQRTSDPLKQLRDEIKKVMGRTVSGVEWKQIVSSQIENNFKDVETRVLNDFTFVNGEEMTNLQRIQQSASDFGIEIKSIELGCRLLEAETEIQRATEEREKKKQLAKLKQESEIEEQKHQIQRTTLTQLEEAVKAAGTGVKRVLEDVDSVTALGKEVQDGLNLFRKVQDEVKPALPTETPLPIAGSISRQTNGQAVLLIEAFNQVNQINCESEAKRRLLSAILHLIGELMLGDDADEELVERYGGKIEALSIEVRPSREQFKYLSSLLEYDDIKAYLKNLV